MMIMWHVCSCGIPLRYSRKMQAYVPLEGSDAPLTGHAVFAVVIDGEPRQASDRLCQAPVSLDKARAARAAKE